MFQKSFIKQHNQSNSINVNCNFKQKNNMPFPKKLTMSIRETPSNEKSSKLKLKSLAKALNKIHDCHVKCHEQFGKCFQKVNHGVLELKKRHARKELEMILDNWSLKFSASKWHFCETHQSIKSSSSANSNNNIIAIQWYILKEKLVAEMSYNKQHVQQHSDSCNQLLLLSKQVPTTLIDQAQFQCILYDLNSAVLLNTSLDECNIGDDMTNILKEIAEYCVGTHVVCKNHKFCKNSKIVYASDLCKYNALAVKYNNNNHNFIFISMMNEYHGLCDNCLERNGKVQCFCGEWEYPSLMTECYGCEHRMYYCSKHLQCPKYKAYMRQFL